MIQQITTMFTGQEGVRPQIVRIACNDSFASVTTENYLLSAQNQGFSFNNGDIALVSYGSPAATEFFVINASQGAISLAPLYAGVSVPVSNGDFAVFSGANGGIADAGYSPSNPAKTKVAMANGTAVAGNLAKFADSAGTVQDAGAKLLAGTTPVYGGGGTSNAFSVAGLSSSAHGSAVARSSTNAVSITSAIPGANTLTVGFSADPGANTTVDYIYSTAALS